MSADTPEDPRCAICDEKRSDHAQTGYKHKFSVNGELESMTPEDVENERARKSEQEKSKEAPQANPETAEVVMRPTFALAIDAPLRNLLLKKGIITPDELYDEDLAIFYHSIVGDDNNG